MKVALLTVLCLSFGITALADTVTYNGSIPQSTTNWTSAITVPKFDPSLGTLTSITFKLTGYVSGNAQFESLDAAPTTVTMDLSANITLKRPDLSDLVVVIPVVSTSDNVLAFDGLIDFGGDSGRTYNSLSASNTNSFVSPPPLSDLALFTATFSGENIVLPVTATGTSTGSGAGNLLLVFATSAGAEAWVTYEYEPIPEPSSIMAIFAGITGLVGVSRFRRNK